MQTATLLSVVALLSTAHCFPSSHRRDSWDRMLANLMQTADTGKCGNGACYVSIGGTTHVVGLDQGFTYPTDPCTVYACTQSGVQTQAVTCKDPSTLDCDKTIRYPGKCCIQCVGPSDEPGEFTEWGEWTECSATCGEGLRARRRECIVSDNAAQVVCTGNILETETCSEGPCPINCEWEYGNFEPCSATCGDGQKERFPVITQHQQHGGRPCPPFVVNQTPDVESCNLRECSVNCEWEYGEYGPCSETCGVGTKQRVPKITQEPLHGGVDCPAFVRNGIPQSAQCNNGECPVDCEWEYLPPGACSKTCGGGRQEQNPHITQPAAHGGQQCPPDVLAGVPKIIICNTNPCPVRCEWEYGEYGPCSETCGVGTKQRVPKITQEPMHGGVGCPAFVINGVPETAQCNNGECPVDCEWEYLPPGACSKTCGGGRQEQHPHITQHAAHGGQQCPADVLAGVPKVIVCNTNPCPIDCEWEYGDYGSCSHTCGGGMKSRYPVITVQPQHGGRECPAIVTNQTPDTTECNTQTCPIVCGPGEHGCMVNGVLTCIADQDGDCIPDNQDNCVKVHNPDQADMDFDGVGDVCDNCRFFRNPDQMNSDNDETGNACDADDDNDGIIDQNDNCAIVVNPDQKDTDRDNVGDACDNCPTRWNNNQADVDKDGVGNACDNCRRYPNPKQLSTDPSTYGNRCKSGLQGTVMEAEEDEGSDKNQVTQLMEKLLEMYYSN